MPNAHAGGIPTLCTPFVESLPISGASVTLLAASGARLTLCSTDSVASRLDELQFELGEGPQWATARSGRMSLIPDVAASEHSEWPLLAAALRDLAVGALFCVPLRMGAVTVGVATLYCRDARRLAPDEQTTALAIASAIAEPAVQHGLDAARDESVGGAPASPAFRREVHQATGIMLVQLNLSATDAFARLQAYAFAHGRTIQAVARDVVAGVVSFDDPGNLD